MTDAVSIDIAALVPHADAMCLLDAVNAWDVSSIHAIGDRYRTHHTHPLRNAYGLLAVHLAEYGAQAMAVHGALLAREHGDRRIRAGRLVSLREVILVDEYVDFSQGRLDVHAECLSADAAGSQYRFHIEQAGRLLASGRAAVIYADT